MKDMRHKVGHVKERRTRMAATHCDVTGFKSRRRRSFTQHQTPNARDRVLWNRSAKHNHWLLGWIRFEVVVDGVFAAMHSEARFVNSQSSSQSIKRYICASHNIRLRNGLYPANITWVVRKGNSFRFVCCAVELVRTSSEVIPVNSNKSGDNPAYTIQLPPGNQF